MCVRAPEKGRDVKATCKKYKTTLKSVIVCDRCPLGIIWLVNAVRL